MEAPCRPICEVVNTSYRSFDLYSKSTLKPMDAPPTTTKLRELGLAWILYAAGLHGGYRSSLMLLELPSPDKPCWKDWDHFAQCIRPIIQGYISRENQVPSGKRLERDGYGWIVSAAQNYHGGYQAVLRRLGLQPPPLPQTGNGLGNPVNFRREFKRVAWMLFQKLGRTPSRRHFLDAGYWGLISAAHRNHGGFSYCLRQSGLALGPGQVRPKIGRWFKLADQLEQIRREFPTLVSLRIMPNVVELRAVCPSLVGYWTSRRVAWPTVAKKFGFIPWKVAAPQMAYVKAVNEALSFYEQHQRWPHARECSHALRAIRFRRGTSWEKALTRTTLHLPLLTQLVDRWRQHVLWMQHHQPKSADAQRLILNNLIIALNGSISLPLLSV